MSAPTSWQQLIKMISDGEAVAASVANRPLSGLASRTNYLKQLLETALMGSAIIAYEVPCSSDCEEGYAVYYDTDGEQFAPAVVEMALDEDSQIYRLTDRAFCVGVILSKLTPTTANVILTGRATLDMSEVLTEDAPAGPYYLSATTPGHVVLQRPQVGIYVMFWDGAGTAYINPQPREVAEEHVHLQFDLTRTPAGIADCGSDEDPITIQCADSEQSGWLPASDPIFNGLAPAGAVYGYNLSAHTALLAAWPPMPTHSAYLELNGIGVNKDLYHVDVNGIWWMSDCAQDVPWVDMDLTCASSSLEDCPSSSEEEESSSSSNCPACEPQLTLWFARMVTRTANSVVFGVYSDDTRIQVYNSYNVQATPQAPATGLVKLLLELAWTTSEDTEGATVIKGITDSTLSTGLVVEGVKGDEYIGATGDDEVGDGYQQGRVQLTFTDPTAITRQLPIELVALDAVREALYENVPYLEFPTAKDSNIRCRVAVPVTSMSSPVVVPTFWLLARSSGTMPDLYLTYRVIEAPANCEYGSSSSEGTSLLDLPDDGEESEEFTLDSTACIGESVTANQYFAIEGPEIPVSSNAIVLFTLRRDSGDAYGGDVGLLRSYSTLRET